MKIAKLKKYVTLGMEFAKEIKRTTNRDDMKIVRCILGNNESNVMGVLKFLGIFPDQLNDVVKVGIFIELSK